MNYLKTTILLALLTGLLLAIGNAFGGPTGMVIAFMFAVIMNFSAYWFSDKMVLKMYDAREVTAQEAPEIYSIVQGLVAKGNIPMPKVYVVQSDTPNAFATGRNPQNAVVAVTTGIMRILDRDELTGVLAHELSHVSHRDTLISTIAATIAGAISMITNFAQYALIFGGRSDGQRGNPLMTLLMIIVAPVAAGLIQMAVSRSREFGADAGGAKLSGKPMALASALQKLERGNEAMPMGTANRNPSTAHLFIVNPLFGGGLSKLFSTHPPTEERVKRLRDMTY